MTESIQGLLEAFAKSATAYGAAIAAGNTKSANTNQEQAAHAYRRLRERGGSEQALLLGLLASDDLAVRYMAAVHAVDFAPAEGERVLGEIMRGPPSPLRMLAQVSLSQWRSGLLRF